MAQGHHPFGAILVAPDHTTVLLEQGNVDTVNHAESTLMRRAFAEFEPDFFAGLHALHHSGALRDVCWGAVLGQCKAASLWHFREAVAALTGNHAENSTLDVPCRYVFEREQKAIAFWGPIAEVEAEIIALHRGFWGE